MGIPPTTVIFADVDASLLKRARRLQTICVAAAAILAGFSLVMQMVDPLRLATLATSRMSGTIACTVLLCCLGWAGSRATRLSVLHQAGIAASILAGLVSLHGLWTGIGGGLIQNLFFAGRQSGAVHRGLTPQLALVFGSITLVLVLAPAVHRMVSWSADALAFGLLLYVLSLISRYLFSASFLFPEPETALTSPMALAAAALLTTAILAQRAEKGVLKVLLAPGIAGRVMRTLAPFIIAMPFFRETLRERLLRIYHVDPHSAAAIFASSAAAAGIVIVVVITTFMRNMETEIHQLSLRDELTGLYNLRGFQLLAEQAFRLADRSNAPFSVMFIDVDELKPVNDGMGHDAGSALLTAAAELLKSNFRQTDIVARIGGDEFAIAGAFSDEEMASAVSRIADQAAAVRVAPHRDARLSLSIGHATASGGAETLPQLLAAADEAMYIQKRRKKMQPCTERLHSAMRRD